MSHLYLKDMGFTGIECDMRHQIRWRSAVHLNDFIISASGDLQNDFLRRIDPEQQRPAILIVNEHNIRDRVSERLRQAVKASIHMCKSGGINRRR